MIKDELVQLFKNTENIKIYATDEVGEYSYLFSFDGLLKVVKETNRKKLTWSIHGTWKENAYFTGLEPDYFKAEGRRSWLFYTFSKRNWQQIYPQISIHYKITNDDNGYKQDLLTLSYL